MQSDDIGTASNNGAGTQETASETEQFGVSEEESQAGEVQNTESEEQAKEPEAALIPAEDDMTLAKYRFDGDTLIFYGGELITKEVVDNALEEHGEVYLLKKIFIEDDVLGIGKYAFDNCRSLTTIYTPSDSYAETWAKEDIQL